MHGEAIAGEIARGIDPRGLWQEFHSPKTRAAAANRDGLQWIRHVIEAPSSCFQHWAASEAELNLAYWSGLTLGRCRRRENGDEANCVVAALVIPVRVTAQESGRAERRGRRSAVQYLILRRKRKPPASAV